MRRLILISALLVLFTGCGGKMDKGTRASVDDFAVESAGAEVMVDFKVE